MKCSTEQMHKWFSNDAGGMSDGSRPLTFGTPGLCASQAVKDIKVMTAALSFAARAAWPAARELPTNTQLLLRLAPAEQTVT